MKRAQSKTWYPPPGIPEEDARLASGYFLTKSKLYRAAQEAVERGLKFAYVGRKNKKRDYRSLWIVRINASCRAAASPTASSCTA